MSSVYTPRKNCGIRAYMAMNDVTHKELAARLYVSKTTIYDWINNDMSVDRKREIVNAVKQIVLLREYDERKKRETRKKDKAQSRG